MTETHVQRALKDLREDLEPYADRQTGSVRIDMDDVRLILAAIARVEALSTSADQRDTAAGHTDLMVSPESIDAFMEANPLPDEDALAAEAKVERLEREVSRREAERFEKVLETVALKAKLAQMRWALQHHYDQDIPFDERQKLTRQALASEATGGEGEA